MLIVSTDTGEIHRFEIRQYFNNKLGPDMSDVCLNYNGDIPSKTDNGFYPMTDWEFESLVDKWQEEIMLHNDNEKCFFTEKYSDSQRLLYYETAGPYVLITD